MAFDKGLAAQVRSVLAGTPALSEKYMFGGVCWLVNGNMALGLLAQGMIVRVGPDLYTATLSEAGVSPFDWTGKPMRGWVVVAPVALAYEASLRKWIEHGLAFASSLPPKR